ncbi:hypothetical protein ES703_07507 [subsurface metagenome]
MVMGMTMCSPVLIVMIIRRVKKVWSLSGTVLRLALVLMAHQQMLTGGLNQIRKTLDLAWELVRVILMGTRMMMYSQEQTIIIIRRVTKVWFLSGMEPIQDWVPMAIPQMLTGGLNQIKIVPGLAGGLVLGILMVTCATML